MRLDRTKIFMSSVSLLLVIAAAGCNTVAASGLGATITPLPTFDPNQLLTFATSTPAATNGPAGPTSIYPTLAPSGSSSNNTNTPQPIPTNSEPTVATSATRAPLPSRTNVPPPTATSVPLTNVVPTSPSTTVNNVNGCALQPNTQCINGNFSGAVLDGVNISGGNLRNASLSGAHMDEGNLSSADLSNANFAGARILRTNLARANLSQANFSGADLSDSDLNSANLRDANASGAFMDHVNLNGADLTRANLSGTELTNADLTGAILTNANLSGARDANLGSAILCRTLMPDGSQSNRDCARVP